MGIVSLLVAFQGMKEILQKWKCGHFEHDECCQEYDECCQEHDECCQECPTRSVVSQLLFLVLAHISLNRVLKLWKRYQ